MTNELLDKQAADALRAHGHRITLPRLLVHRFVRQAPQHVTADDVHAHLPSLSTATVYATLELFESMGIVRRVSTFEGTAVFDSHTEPHHHAVCRNCGRMFDLEPATISQPAVPEGFKVEHTDVQVVGLCESCASSSD
jgi:Fe2+ or Zn2+ uptake regulation protein